MNRPIFAYICYPFESDTVFGVVSNTELAIRLSNRVRRIGMVPIATHPAGCIRKMFGMKELSRDEVMKECISIALLCDVIVVSDVLVASKGMEQEMSSCNMPIVRISVLERWYGETCGDMDKIAALIKGEGDQFSAVQRV